VRAAGKRGAGSSNKDLFRLTCLGPAEIHGGSSGSRPRVAQETARVAPVPASAFMAKLGKHVLRGTLSRDGGIRRSIALARQPMGRAPRLVKALAAGHATRRAFAYVLVKILSGVANAQSHVGRAYSRPDCRPLAQRIRAGRVTVGAHAAAYLLDR